MSDYQSVSKTPNIDLGKELFALRQTGQCVDVYFSVIPFQVGETRKIPAHKCVLMAISPIFSTVMTQRWNHGDVLTVPEKICVEAVEHFVKFLYLGELDDEIDTDVILQLMLLADYYLIEPLFQLCDELLRDIVNQENCIFIYQHARLYERSGIRKDAQEYILYYISLQSSLWESEMSDLEAYTLEDLLNLSYSRDVSELTLFEVLMAWRDYDVERRCEKFTKLLKLVRFPIMKPEEFAEFVVPSAVLSKDEMLEIFISYTGKGTTKFSTVKRNIILAKNSKEFQSALVEVVSGDVIQLCEGIYENSHFVIDKDGITIVGVEQTKTILQCTSSPLETNTLFSIFGSNCEVKNLSIDYIKWDQSFYHNQVPLSCCVVVNGNNNNISNISLSNGLIGLSIHGNNNKFDTFTITEIFRKGASVTGNENSFLNGSLTFVRDGIILNGNDNTVSHLQCKDIHRGVLISGNNNSVQELTHKIVNPEEMSGKNLFPKNKLNLLPAQASLAVCINNGDHNSVSHVTTEGNGLWGGLNTSWIIVLCDKTKYCNVENCKANGLNGNDWFVQVQGKYHNLNEVDGGHSFRIEGFGHTLEKCRGTTLNKLGTNCIEKVEDCNFSSVVTEDIVVPIEDYDEDW